MQLLPLFGLVSFPSCVGQHSACLLLLDFIPCVVTISSTYSSGVKTLTANNSSNRVPVCQQPIFELTRSPFACVTRTRLGSSAPHLSNKAQSTRGLHPYSTSASGSGLLPTQSRKHHWVRASSSTLEAMAHTTCASRCTKRLVSLPPAEEPFATTELTRHTERTYLA